MTTQWLDRLRQTGASTNDVAPLGHCGDLVIAVPGAYAPGYTTSPLRGYSRSRIPCWGLSRFLPSKNGTVPFSGSRIEGRGTRVEGRHEAADAPRGFYGLKRPSSSLQPPASSLSVRRGISVLEVLISIFVLSIGLFGLAALLPIATYQVAQADRLDRGGALGRQAVREATSFLHPALWMNGQGQLRNDLQQFQTNIPDPFAPNGLNQPFFHIDPFIIDPMALRLNASGQSIDPNGPPMAFPLAESVEALAKQALAQPYPLQMERLTLANQTEAFNYWQRWTEYLGDVLANPSATTPNVTYPTVMRTSLLERTFYGTDDLAFARPEDDAFRPQQMFQRDANQDLLARQFEGNYSWLMMVTPNEYEETLGVFIGDRKAFTISVVVFNRRKLPLLRPGDDPSIPPTERMVRAEMEGNGLGGGSLHLEADDEVTLTEIRPNGWLLLCARRLSGVVDANADPRVFRWYRIVSVDDGSGLDLDPPHRDLTVAGPDWNTDGTLYETPFYALLVDDVVGVYERNVFVDRSSPWAR